MLASAVLSVVVARDLNAQPEAAPPMIEAGPMPSAVPIPRMPSIALQALPGYGVAPLTVGFMVTFPDPTVQFETYRWDFGDGKVSTMPPMMLFHTYTQPGSYVVTLTATTTDGHLAMARAGVVARPTGLK